MARYRVTNNHVDRAKATAWRACEEMLIHNRSPEQIACMEAERGLAA